LEGTRASFVEMAIKIFCFISSKLRKQITGDIFIRVEHFCEIKCEMLFGFFFLTRKIFHFKKNQFPYIGKNVLL